MSPHCPQIKDQNPGHSLQGPPVCLCPLPQPCSSSRHPRHRARPSELPRHTLLRPLTSAQCPFPSLPCFLPKHLLPEALAMPSLHPRLNLSLSALAPSTPWLVWFPQAAPRAKDLGAAVFLGDDPRAVREEKGEKSVRGCSQGDRSGQ